MGSIDLPYLHRKTNRLGAVYWYYRRRGRSVALPGEPGSAEWMAVYWREREHDDRIQPARKEPARTFKRLALEYFQTPTFQDLKLSTKRAYRSSIDQFIEKFGGLRVDAVKYRHLNKIIGDMADRPGAANNLLKRLRAMFEVAILLEWIDRDPSKGIKFYRLGEIHTWTDDEIQQFRDRWKPGTLQRLAFTLQLYTGQRNSDVVKEPWPRDGVIRVTQEKTGAHLWLPVAPELSEELDRHQRAHTLILATAQGKTRSIAGYGNFMRDAIRKAGLPARCAPHGLRKAAAAHLAEAGCTTREIMAITGHQTLAEVERYTRGADQIRLAQQATAKRTENRQVATRGQQSGHTEQK